MSYFQNEIKLHDLVIQALAISYWEKDDIRIKVREFLSAEQDARNAQHGYWYWFIAQVIKKVDPSEVKKDYLTLTTAIKSVGKRIFAWYKKIREFYNKDTDRERITLEELYDLYLDQIYWRSDYTIDEVKMIKSAWDKSPKISMINKYEQACHYCLEEDIKSFPEDIMKDWNLMTSTNTHLIAYWEYWRKNDLEGFNDKIIGEEMYGRDCTEENMLRLSCRKGYTYAVKYFWEKIRNKGAENIYSFLKDVVRRYPYPRRVPSYHEQVDSLTNILFFLSYLSKHFEEETVLSAVRILDLCKISDLCIFFWHCYDDYIPVAQKVLKGPKISDYGSLVRHILWGFRWEWHYYQTPLTHSFHYELFHKIWGVSPPVLKQSLIQGNQWYGNQLQTFLGELCEVHDFSHVQLIINDPDLTKYKRKDLLKPNSTEFKEEFFSEEIFKKMAAGGNRYAKFGEMFTTAQERPT